MFRLVERLIAYAKKRPYHHLGSYMLRYWLKDPGEDCRTWGARIHNIKRSDHDRCLHDHPWPNASILLAGGYWEVMPGAFQAAVEARADARPIAGEMAEIQRVIESSDGRRIPRATRRAYARAGVHWRGPGAIVRRRASQAHRLVVPAGREAYSLFIMGARTSERGWGFHTPDGWEHADSYRAKLGREV